MLAAGMAWNDVDQRLWEAIFQWIVEDVNSNTGCKEETHGKIGEESRVGISWTRPEQSELDEFEREGFPNVSYVFFLQRSVP